MAQRYSLAGSFQNDDGSVTGDITGMLTTGNEETGGHAMGDSDSGNPTWDGVLSGQWETDEEDETAGTFLGGWTRDRYSEFAPLEGVWTGEEDRLGGRVIGSFDFEPVAPEEPTDTGDTGGTGGLPDGPERDLGL